MQNKVIICVGENSQRVASAAFAHAFANKCAVHMLNIMDPFRDAICVQLGLPFKANTYCGEGDFTKEFLGREPIVVFQSMQIALEHEFGDDILGRAAMRRIKRETQADHFVCSDLPNVASLRTLAIELGAQNIMLLQSGKPLDIEPHDEVVLKGMDKRLIPANDHSAMRLLTQGCVEHFFDLGE